MRSFLTLLIIVGFSALSFGQDINSYQFKRDFLPYEAELPRGLLNFVPDSLQKTLFNPSFASRYDRNFFSGSYFSSFGGGVNIRLTGYIKSDEERGWFFSYAGLNRESETDRIASEDFELQTTLGPVLLLEDDNNVFFRDDDYEARLLRVIQKGEVSNAYGLVLAYESEKATNNVINIDRTSVVSEATDGMGTVISRQTRSSVRNLDFKFGEEERRFVIGLEQYKSTPSSDVIRRFYYERLESAALEDLIVFQRDMIRTEDLINGTVIDSEATLSNIGDGRSDLTANTFRYYEFKSLKLNDEGNKALYYQLDALYGSGEDDIRTLTEIGNTPNPEAPIRLNSDDLERQFQTRLDLGYVTKKSFKNLNYVAALQLSYAYAEQQNQAFDVVTTAVFKLKQEVLQHFVSAEIPLFAQFKISDHVNMWGGSSLGYSYSANRTKNSEFRNAITALDLRTYESQLQRSFTTFSNNYIGMDYTHESGFRVILGIRDNLNNPEVWRVSVVYPF